MQMGGIQNGKQISHALKIRVIAVLRNEANSPGR